MRTSARIVRVQSRRKIRGQPSVVAAWIAGTLENVDDALRQTHDGAAYARRQPGFDIKKIGVKALAMPEMLVEIECEAMMELERFRRPKQ